MCIVYFLLIFFIFSGLLLHLQLEFTHLSHLSFHAGFHRLAWHQIKEVSAAHNSAPRNLIKMTIKCLTPQALQAWAIHSNSERDAWLRQLFNGWKRFVACRKAALEVRDRVQLEEPTSCKVCLQT